MVRASSHILAICNLLWRDVHLNPLLTLKMDCLYIVELAKFFIYSADKYLINLWFVNVYSCPVDFTLPFFVALGFGLRSLQLL
jgi:hypothetical protein